MAINVDYFVVLVQLGGITAEEAQRIADTQQVPILIAESDKGARGCYVPDNYKGPRTGEFEFFGGTVQQVTLSFVALYNAPLTEAQAEEVVRAAGEFAPGTVVHGLDCQGIWTVISDQDGVTKEYCPAIYSD